MRKRKDEVMYDDGLTEKQFVRRMERQAEMEEQQQLSAKRRDSSGGQDGKLIDRGVYFMWLVYMLGI